MDTILESQDRMLEVEFLSEENVVQVPLEEFTVNIDTYFLRRWLESHRQLTKKDSARNTNRIIRRLKTRKYRKRNSAEEEQCSICCLAYQKRRVIKYLPCEHNFHKTCIDKWLKQKMSCPLCRETIQLENV